MRRERLLPPLLALLGAVGCLGPPAPAGPPPTPAVSLAGRLPAEARVGAEIAIEARVTNHGPGDIGDLGLELISFRGPVSGFALLGTEPAARFGWTGPVDRVRIFRFGPLRRGERGVYRLRLSPGAAGEYPLRVALDDFAGDPWGRPLQDGAAAAAFEGTLRVW